jgi:hypothetical protein
MESVHPVDDVYTLERIATMAMVKDGANASTFTAS